MATTTINKLSSNQDDMIIGDGDDEVVVKCEEFEECGGGGGGGGGEESSCLICLSSDTGCPQRWKQFWSPGEPLSVSRNLSTVFLLRNLLGVESGQVAALLSSTFGVEPGAWVRLCGGCSETVRNAYQNHQECLKLQREIEAIGEELRKEIGTSWKLIDSESEPGSLVRNGDGGGGGGIVNVHQLIRDLFPGRQGSSHEGHDIGGKNIIFESESSPSSYSPPPSSIRPDNYSDDDDSDDDNDDDDQLNGLDQDSGSNDDDDDDDSDSQDGFEVASAELPTDPLSIIPGENSSDHRDEEETKGLMVSPTTRVSPRRQSRWSLHSTSPPPTPARKIRSLKENKEGSAGDGMTSTSRVRVVSTTKREKVIGRPKKNPPAREFLCPRCNHPSRCRPGRCAFQESPGSSLQVVFANVKRRGWQGWGVKRMYKCKVCKLSFDTKAPAQCHVSKTHNSKKSVEFQCPICGDGRLFSSHTTRLSHMRRAHPKAKLRCGRCDGAFETEIAATYFTHENEHKFMDALEPVGGGEGKVGEERLRCRFCDASGSWTEMLRHLKMKHLPELGMTGFGCSLCDMVFLNNSELTKHLMLRHRVSRTGQPITRNRDFKCDLCSSSYHAKDTLLQHMKNVHPEPDEGIIKKRRRGFQTCGICGAEFTTRHLLQLHLEEEHADRLQVKCEQCGAGFESEVRLLSHLTVSHQQQHQSSCSTTTTTSAETGLVVVECRHCGKKVSRSNLWQHLKTHEKMGTTGLPKERKEKVVKKVKPEPFKCDKCEFSTDGRRGRCKLLIRKHLLGHAITDHFEDLGDSKVRCRLCSVVLHGYNYNNKPGDSSRNYGLVRHLRVSHGELSLPGLLSIVHRRRRRQRGMYQCGTCGREFAHLFQRKRHVQQFHSGGGGGVPQAAGSSSNPIRCSSSSSSSSRRPTYSCDKCDFTTQTKVAHIHHVQNHSLVVHFQEVEGDGDGGVQKFLCKLCGIRCSRMKRYAHLNQMHAQVIDFHLYQCHLCGKGFNNMKNVKVHLAWHGQQNRSTTEETEGKAGGKFVCETCGVSSPSLSQLISHRRKSHSEVVENHSQVVRCKACEFSAPNWHLLSAHMRESHDELYRHMCDACDKRFQHAYQVEIHKEKYHFEVVRVNNK